jgi:hypothetical protein
MKKDFICISYVPLLRPGQELIQPRDDVLKLVDEALNTEDRIRAVLWTLRDDAVCPVFLLDNASEVKDHFIEWSEGQPTEWFVVTGDANWPAYGICLMPKLHKSIERWELRLKLAGMELPKKKKDKVSILFVPLYHSAPKSTCEDVVKRLFKQKTCSIGFLDIKDSEDGFPKWDEAISYIDGFRVEWGSEFIRNDLANRMKERHVRPGQG